MSRMTNGTISGKGGGSSVIVSYKSPTSTGAQDIVIPPGIPVVTFAPGSRSDLKPGANVFVMAVHSTNGKFSAVRVMVGKNGAKPPM